MSLQAWALLSVAILGGGAVVAIVALLIHLGRMDRNDERHDEQTALSLVAHGHTDDEFERACELASTGQIVYGKYAGVHEGCRRLQQVGSRDEACVECRKVMPG